MNRIVEYSFSTFLGVAAYLFWAIPYRAMLNYHEEFQLFQLGSDYFASHISQCGGFSVYLSEFLVQFYNNYWIGALIVALEFVLIQRLTLGIIKRLSPSLNFRHGYFPLLLSLIPVAFVWLVLGDVNVMHSITIAVILALLFAYLLVRAFGSNLYRLFGFIVLLPLYVWLCVTGHNRIPGSSAVWGNIYNQKTAELLDYDLMVRMNRWDLILQTAEHRQPDLPMSVCATNLALGMTNQIGRRAHQFFQNGTEGLFPSFAKDPFSTLTYAELYFQLGLINTSQRYYFEAMEAAPDYKKSCRCIRRLAETNLVNGSYEVASKYLRILERTSVYRKWAQRMLGLISQGDMAILNHPLYGRMRRMKLSEDFIYSDREIDKICGRLVMHNYDNVLAMQYMLMYPLLEGNYTKFEQYMNLIREEVPYSQEYASFEKYLRQH